MPDITLTASARGSLLSLTKTASLMTRTQSRLTSGLKVSSATDDAVSYFKSKALTDRTTDFTSRKDEIDQGISRVRSVSALLGGNVTFLQSRLDFTNNDVNTLQEGSGETDPRRPQRRRRELGVVADPSADRHPVAQQRRPAAAVDSQSSALTILVRIHRWAVYDGAPL